jgi:ADP-ribosylation factor related protein 1
LLPEKSMFSLVFGFLKWAIARDEARILLAGLDGSGKTLLLEHIKQVFLRDHKAAPPAVIPPTIGMNLSKVPVSDMDVTIWDVGGTMRKIWGQYYGEVDGVIFVVDACDRARFEEARLALTEILTHTAGSLPVLLVANKQDLPHATGGGGVMEAVGRPAGLNDTSARVHRVIEVSALKDSDARDVVVWITEQSRAGALERQ